MSKKRWTEENLKLLQEFVVAGKSAGFIASHFGITKSNLWVVLSNHKISLKEKGSDSGTPSGLQKLHKEKVKDYAYRLMVLKGEAIRIPEEIPPFTDEQLKKWGDINQFCNDLLFWMGNPLVLLEYQKDMIKMIENNRYSIVVSGRQVGKDMVASAYALWKCITSSNYFAIIVSPSQRQSDELFMRIQHFIASGDIYYSVKVSRADEVIFSNGSRILSLPSRGAITGLTHLKLALINEAGRSELPENIVDEIMPMTMAVEGKLVLLGNPYSKATAFYNYYQNPLFAHMHIQTKQNTSLINVEKYLEEERNRCTKTEYLQQYEGVFADFPSAFIPGNMIDKSIKDYDYCVKKKENLIYGVGIDWGIKTDESVLVVVSKDDENKIVIEYGESWSGQSLSYCSNKLAYLDEIYNFNKIIPEEAGLSLDEVGRLKEKYSEGKLQSFIPTNESQFEIYKNLLRHFEQGLITLPMNEIKLINQLRYLELKQTATGKFKIEGGKQGHDDWCDALALAVLGLTGGDYDVIKYKPELFVR